MAEFSLDAAVPLILSGQAAFSAVQLSTREAGRRAADRLLAVFFGILACNMAVTALYASGAIADHPHLARVTLPLELLYGPLFYLYTRTTVGYRLSRRDAWHLAPALAMLLWLVPFYLLDADAKRAVTNRSLQGRSPEDWARWLANWGTLSGYAIASTVLLRQHAARVRAQLSDIRAAGLGWLRRTAVALLFAQAVELAFTLVDTWRHAPVVNSAQNSFALLVLSVIIATLALRQPALRFEDESVPVAAEPPAIERPPDDLAGRRYERSGLTDAEVAALAARLERLMTTDRPWRESGLSLGQLAARLDVSPHHLSRVLNERLERSFFDYVTGWRIQEVQRLLHDPAMARRSILELAYDAGFASKSSFNAAFKTATGLTPTAYRRARSA